MPPLLSRRQKSHRCGESVNGELHAAILWVAGDQAARMLFMTGGTFTPRGQEFLDKTENPWIEKPFDATRPQALIDDRIR